MRTVLLLIATILFAACSQAPAPEPIVEKPPMERDADADTFIKRMKEPAPANLMQSAIRNLAQDNSNFERSDAVMKRSMAFLGALSRYENGDPASLKEYGGVKPFKDQCTEWLKDDDQAVRAFAAAMLGVSGDRSYTPQLAELLKDRPPAKNRFDRGRAAIALGMVGATEFAPQISKLLTSSELNDRQGAALGLGFMNAKEYAPQIAKLLNDKESNVRNDAFGALKLMGMESLAGSATK